MQPTSIILVLACFSAKTFAQEVEDADSTFLQDAEVSSEIAEPPSSVANQIASATPKLDYDIGGYVSALVGRPPFISAVSELDPILPADAKSQIVGDPAGFVINFITATELPDWATAIPPDVASYVVSVGEDVSSIITKDVTILPLPLPQPPGTTLGPRPGSSGTTVVPITRPTIVATSPAFTVTTAPAGSGMLPSGASRSGTGASRSVTSASGSGTGRIVTPTSPSSPSVSPILRNSASQSGGMIGAVAALMVAGVGALLLA